MNNTISPPSGRDDSDQQQEQNNNRTENNRPRRKKSGLLLILLLFFSLAYFTQHEALVNIECSPDIIASKPDVIMMGALWCRKFQSAKKNYQKNKIKYFENDIEKKNT